MARKKKRGDPHVRLYGWMMKTPAWQSLTAGPQALLILLYSLYNGTNNGQLFLSIREAAKRLHTSPNTVSPWFDVLIERGFIKVSQRGAFSMKVRHATTWTLTEHPVGETLATKEFARWRPGEVEAKPSTRRGGFRWNRSTRAQAEIQNTASKADTNGVKDCVNGADPSGPKEASRCQSLTPMEAETAAHGVKHCDTGKLPCGADFSERTKMVGAMAEGAQPSNARSDRGHCIGRLSPQLLGWREPAALRKPPL
jgi:hypothetical protein